MKERKILFAYLICTHFRTIYLFVWFSIAICFYIAKFSHTNLNTSWTFLEFLMVMKSMRTPLRKLIVIRKCEKSREHMYIHKASPNFIFWWITLMLTSWRVANGDSVVLCFRTVSLYSTVNFYRIHLTIILSRNLRLSFIFILNFSIFS